MNIGNKSTLLAEVNKLVELKLYDSAETLCSLYLSHLNNVEFKPRKGGEPISIVFADVYECLGDILYKREEIKRALHYFRCSSHRRRSQQASKFRTQGPISTAEEARLRYKECRCQVNLHDASNVIRDLESIPPKLRDCKMNMLLGEMYCKFNRKRNAILAYKDALSNVPYSIEIIEQLVSLGVDAAEILSALDEALRYKDSAALAADGWMHILVAALVTKRNHEHEKSLTNFNKLSTIYPKNTYLLTQQAQACLEADQLDHAMVLYRQVRREDPYLVRHMETFGKLLFMREDANELSKLTDDVLEAQARLPVGWVLAAMYSTSKGDAETSVAFLDKAVALDAGYSESYKFRGQLLQLQECPDQAIIAYSQARALDCDFATFSGLVKANLAMGKVKEAAAVAREALGMLPKSCEAYILMGKVFAQSQSAPGEALSAYAKALQLNPLSKVAAMSMAELLVAQGKAQEAAACLENILKKVSCHKLRLALGRAHAAQGQYKQAVEQLHTSISLNSRESDPESEAMQELERIEGLIKGEAEEEAEEDEDHMHSTEFVGDSFVGGAGEEDAETAASIALSMYYQAAGMAAEDDLSASLNPREYMDYEGGYEGDGNVHEHSYFQEEASGEEDHGLLYGSLDNSAEEH